MSIATESLSGSGVVRSSLHPFRGAPGLPPVDLECPAAHVQICGLEVMSGAPRPFSTAEHVRCCGQETCVTWDSHQSVFAKSFLTSVAVWVFASFGLHRFRFLKPTITKKQPLTCEATLPFGLFGVTDEVSSKFQRALLLSCVRSGCGGAVLDFAATRR